jgi:hypothetical protein
MTARRAMSPQGKHQAGKTMTDKTDATTDPDFDDFEGDHFQVTITVDVIASNATEAAKRADWSRHDACPATTDLNDDDGNSAQNTPTDEQLEEALADELSLDVL